MIYKLHITDPSQESRCYVYCGSMKEVRKAKEKAEGDGYHTEVVDKSDKPKGKQAIIDLLNLWGSHPDNG